MTAKDRSPRYPVISLPEALAKAELVWKKDRRNKIPKEVVAQHMGYTTLNGASMGTIAAAMKYGLVEGTKEAMGISERALAIFANEEGSPERAEAIHAAAHAPEIFRRLSERFPENGSDAAMRSHLITQAGFIPPAAETVVRVFRDTMSLVAASARAYPSPAAKTAVEEKMGATATVGGSAQTHPAVMIQPAPGAGKSLRVLLSEEGVEVQATVRDRPTLRKLIRWLQANEEMLPADADEESGLAHAAE